jgi:hypothetical protein
MGEPAQTRQFGILALPQPGKHLADHAIHAIGGLTLGDARAPGNALRDFRFPHPISMYQRGAAKKPLPAARSSANPLIPGGIAFYLRPGIPGD